MTKPYYEDDHAALYHGDCLELADLWPCATAGLLIQHYGKDGR